MRALTVAFYVDGDYGVEPFVREVLAKDAEDAFAKAVALAKADGGTTSGRTLRDHEWECATEVAIFVGHGLSVYQEGSTASKSAVSDVADLASD
jgi:hypothetical protein